MRTATSLLRGATIYLRTVHAVTSRAASRLKRLGHFCRALTVAREIGLSHPTPMLLGWGRRIVSEDSGHSVHPLPAAVHPFSESKNRAVLGVAQGPGRAGGGPATRARSPAPSRLRAQSARRTGRCAITGRRRRLTSPSHPPLPATRFVPQPSVSRADRSEQRPIVLRDIEGGRETQASYAAAASAAETTNLPPPSETPR
jgi:hypothetical protein